MGWEYRWFAPLTDAARLGRLRAGVSREDVYYIATDDLGIKLRNGRGDVEVKVCKERRPAPGGGAMEHWNKYLVSAREVVPDGRRCDRSVLVDKGFRLPKLPDARLEGLQVHVAKERTHTSFGEVTDVLLRTRILEGGDEPLTHEEAWHSLCVEGHDPTDVAQTAQSRPGLQPPEGSFVGGYPALVAECARRALARAADSPSARDLRSPCRIQLGQHPSCQSAAASQLPVPPVHALSAVPCPAQSAAAGEADEAIDEPPLVFLDIDGVLNTTDMMTGDSEDAYYPTGWEPRMREWGFVLSRTRLEALAGLVRGHDARVVLSTAWRTDHGARRALAAALTQLCGVPASVFVSVTPELRRQTRAAEIAQWLATHDSARRRRWIAIDDLDLAREDPEAMADHFVHTSAASGLTDAAAAFADELLLKSRRDVVASSIKLVRVL